MGARASRSPCWRATNAYREAASKRRALPRTAPSPSHATFNYFSATVRYSGTRDTVAMDTATDSCFVNALRIALGPLRISLIKFSFLVLISFHPLFCIHGFVQNKPCLRVQGRVGRVAYTAVPRGSHNL